jgi:hypothetical protein
LQMNVDHVGIAYSCRFADFFFFFFWWLLLFNKGNIHWHAKGIRLN